MKDRIWKDASLRIQRATSSGELTERLQKEITEAAVTLGVSGRVCGGACATTCGTCGSTLCQCNCSPDCPDAPQGLSSDPRAHPIERGIVGLVFAMTRLGLFTPCWSCEGHSRTDGSLWKAPMVWFYCDATVHVRMLSDGLTRLANAKHLHARWRVAVTYSDPENPRTTFSLEPALPFDETVTLEQLQADTAAIGRTLQGMIVEEGRTLGRAVAT